jgi:hypothetical protein
MNIEERQNYDKMFETFSTEGWKLLQKRFVEMFTEANNLFSISDEKMFWQQRGSLGMLQFFIELEAVVTNERNQAESEEVEDEQLDD